MEDRMRVTQEVLETYNGDESNANDSIAPIMLRHKLIGVFEGVKVSFMYSSLMKKIKEYKSL